MNQAAESLRVAFISVHGDPDATIGGEEAGGQNVYVRQVGEALARRGWQVDMFSRWADPQAPQIVEHAGDRCRTIRLPAGPVAPIPRQEGFGYLAEFLAAWQDFARTQELRYALVHSHYWLSGWVGLQLQASLGLPLVCTYHSLGAVKYRSVPTVPPIAATRLQTERACLEASRCVVATSPQEREFLRALVSERGHIEVIPCGTDISRFGARSRDRAREHLGFDPTAQIVAYVGRFDPRKGIEVLVRATAHLCQQKGLDRLQVLVGGGSTPGRSDGDERDRLEQLVADLGLKERVRFVGRVSDEDLPAYYAAADVCAVPSYYEPFGLVAIEAMASGTPVVASNVGGLQYTVVPEETGLLVPPKDDLALAKAIGRILQEPAWGQRLGTSGRARVEEKFAWDGVARQLDELYRDLLQARSHQ